MSDTDLEKTALAVAEPEEATQLAMEPQAEATQFAANVDCPVCHTPNPPSETYCIDCGFLLASEAVAVAEVPETPDVGKLVTPDGTREFALKPGENTVGRENADILLSHNTVSRRHAKVTVEDGGVYLEDLNSTNGTTVDGERTSSGQRIELKDGCEISFGSAVVKFVAGPTPQPPPDSGGGEAGGEGEAPAEPDVAAEPTPQPPPEAGGGDETGDGEASGEGEAPAEPVAEPERIAVGKLVSKDGALSFDLFDGTNTIGRREGANDIVVPDPYCSGRHAEIAAEDGKFTLTDVGSTNGTLVNGVRVEANDPRELAEGDEITLGQTVFGIERDG